MPSDTLEAVSEIRELSYAEAVREALGQAMEADERVFLFGEDVGVYGGAFGVSGDLVHRFGTDRVIDTLISELGIAGAAVGAAITGMRPVLKSSSRISLRSRWSSSLIRRPRSASCSAARRACRWSCVRPAAPVRVPPPSTARA